MREEYDFTGGERGKFFSTELSPPIHLDPDNFERLKRRSEKEGRSMDELVNALLRSAAAE